MAASSSRNNLLAGSFLLASVALAVVASFILSDVGERMRSTSEYVVRFSIQQGAAGIKGGSPVTLGGQPVGKVMSVAVVPDAASAGERGSVDVTVRIDSRFELADNALFTLEKPLLGSLTSINIVSMGNPATVRPEERIGPGPQLLPGERIEGSVAPPSFLADAGLGSEQVMDLRSIIEKAKSAMEKVDELIESNAALVRAALEDVRSATGSARASIETISEKVPGWTLHVDSFLSNADDAGSRLPALGTSAQGVIDDSRGLVGDLRGLVNENRPKIDQFFESLDAAAVSIRETIEPAGEQPRRTMESFESLATRLDTIVATESSTVRRTMANARLASDQLKLAMMEIRAQPWRLLVQPDTKELQQQLLYDSARSYASALSDLRASATALETITASGVRPGIDPAEVARLKRELDEALERYRVAESRLFEQIGKTER